MMNNDNMNCMNNYNFNNIKDNNNKINNNSNNNFGVYNYNNYGYNNNNNNIFNYNFNNNNYNNNGYNNNNFINNCGVYNYNNYSYNYNINNNLINNNCSNNNNNNCNTNFNPYNNNNNFNNNKFNNNGYFYRNYNINNNCDYINKNNNNNYNINTNNINNNNIIQNQKNNLNININNPNDTNIINNNKNKNNNFTDYDNNWTIIFLKKPDNDYFDTYPFININIQITPYETVNELINKYRTKSEDNKNKIFLFESKDLKEYPRQTLKKVGLENLSKIEVLYKKLNPTTKALNIQFIESSQNLYQINYFSNLSGFLKLYILKEIALKLNNNHLQCLLNDRKNIYKGYIMNILKNGYSKINRYNDIDFEFMIDNISNFSKYIDRIIDSDYINKILNDFLKKEELIEIYNTSYRLSKYNNFMNLLEFELERSQKESIFEFAINSFIIIERQDYETFLKEIKNCPGGKQKILFYGISFVPNPNNLQKLYRKENLTDSFEICWFQSDSNTINERINKIPGLDQSFNLIAYYTYYKNDGIKYEINNNHLEKNEINITFKDSSMKIITQTNPKNYFGKEYKIGDINQICPLISFNLKRIEFCIIWRDTNFSNTAYFKQFLEEMKNKKGKYNLYPCQTTEEALSLVNRKKYNKIILISNFGNSGLSFIEEARQIIGNEVIALFASSNPNNITSIQKFKNTLFSNKPEFTEKYLKCFNYNLYPHERKNMILNLINEMEKEYNAKFNFDNRFLDYPNYKRNGQYSDLSF